MGRELTKCMENYVAAQKWVQQKRDVRDFHNSKDRAYGSYPDAAGILGDQLWRALSIRASERAAVEDFQACVRNALGLCPPPPPPPAPAPPAGPPMRGPGPTRYDGV